MLASIKGLIRSRWTALWRSLVPELRETLPLVEEARALGKRTRDYLGERAADPPDWQDTRGDCVAASDCQAVGHEQHLQVASAHLGYPRAGPADEAAARLR